ncbi:hypothetical protein SAMN05421847_1333 [Halpernia humi]|uniref:Uncharacterized protein n=1 Tax=Halpernia humi TaxID=493375 RepID=A0A1H5WUL1_9FLAO|nr:DUF5687 family protein [Halpernia humi]SEG02930.1 hypothetical protein SAMN05421847_1333 [Halpernia humi]
MFKKFLNLEIKSFFRSPRFASGIAMKIATVFLMLYFSGILISAAFGLFYFGIEGGKGPINLFSRYFLAIFVGDLVLKFLWQQMPTNNVKPLLTQNIKKNVITRYTLVKILSSFFSWAFLLFLIPFVALLIFHGTFPIVSVFSLVVAALSLVVINTFINIIINKNDYLMYAVFAVLISFAALQYFKIIDIFSFSEQFFLNFYNLHFLFLIPLVIAIVFGVLVFKFIKSNLYLDKGLELKKSVGKTENIEFLNQFGAVGTFLNNDLKLIKRSKAAKGAALSGVFFLFYGLFFISSKNVIPPIFPGIFITGGFMIVFGQKVPAWDSSYYSLMMTQNVPYKEYLKAKWWLVVIATIISMLLATVYGFYQGWEYYFAIFAAGLYNLGVNAYVTLFAGAFNKRPVDLNSAAKGFSNGQNNFNIKNFLLIIPQFLVPIGVFLGVKYFLGLTAAVIAIAIIGFIGFLLRDKIFDLIVKTYKTEKYSTLSAFKKLD